MTTLLIETTGADRFVAIAEDDRILSRFFSRSEDVSTSLKDGLQDLLAETGTRLQSLEGIAVDCGPGGLSSTRCGVAFANAVGYALRRPVAAIGYVSALARELKASEAQPVLWRPPRAETAGGARILFGIDQATVPATPETIERALASAVSFIVLGGPAPDLFPGMDARLKLMTNPPPISPDTLWKLAEARLRELKNQFSPVDPLY